jgi:hypothetical protein
MNKKKPIKLLAVVFIFICANLLFAEDISWHNLKIGDNIIEYFKEHTPKVLVQGKKLSGFEDWPECKIDYLKYKPITVDSDQKILYVLNKYIIGVLQNENNESYFLYDINGDGVIDVQADFMFVPFWVIKGHL